MANDILQLLNKDKDDIKKLFHNIISPEGSENKDANESHNFLNKLLKYKSYLTYVLPLLTIN